MTVVAVSAAYGAGGSRVCETLARELDVPFVGRAIDHRVAGALEVSIDEAAHQWEPPERTFLERFLTNFLGVDGGAPVGGLPADTTSPEDFRRAAEAAVVEQAATGEGIILGRGSVGALREDPGTLRVRLGGPVEARLDQATELAGITREEATARMRRLDRYHADYMRTFYDVDIEDPALYHLVIDATVLPVAACVGLIELAARTRAA